MLSELFLVQPALSHLNIWKSNGQCNWCAKLFQTACAAGLKQ